MHEAQARLEHAATLPETLAASFDAFEVIRLLARDVEDKVPALFAALMTAADAAVDGREAITAAPSLPPGTGGGISNGRAAPRDDDLAGAADTMTALAMLLGKRLADAAALATTAGDRAACQEASAAAGRICHLMAGGQDDCRLR